jgi:VacB/RNase II family 3'-5' exoribonuclease
MDQKSALIEIAYQAMISRGLQPTFSDEMLRQLEGIHQPAKESDEAIRDLTGLLWCSIDNDDSMDLDQITVAERISKNQVKIWIAIADVDAIVKVGTPIDDHAKTNTTSVYTGVITFPMLPEKLSTNLTSLSQGEERLALVIEMLVDEDGRVGDSDVYRARVKNRAKLAYNSVAAWLDEHGPLPPPASAVPGIDLQLRLQDEVAQRMRRLRHEHGALELETIEAREVLRDGMIVDLKHDQRNRAHELIEDFMVAANGVTAKFLTQRKYPTLRRVVRSPEKWDRIVAIAVQYGDRLPAAPDSKALGEFLSRRRKADPLRFPDLSLTIVKLLGRGIYVVSRPGETPVGHFGLAVQDYSHSTAPNRRFPDLITHRLIKAALVRGSLPYTEDDLQTLATHCTEQENAADRVERQVRKSAAALVLSPRLGEYFDAIVTGASEKGTWARVFSPPVEGKIVHGWDGLEVGDRVRLKLVTVNVAQGWIDFVNVGR